MAGGVGTRFWPASREMRPKQFLDILGVGKSLLQLTFERAHQLVPASNIIIVSNKKYFDLIQQQLPVLKSDQILLEPSMNNTAPCVLYSALHLQARNPKAVFAIWPSDHVVLKEVAFGKRMNLAFDYAEKNKAIVTLGIQPTRPDTGYGYINFEQADTEVKDVKEFKEKPDKATAQKYLDSGDYLWNAGIFVWSVETIIQSYKKNSASIMAVLGENMSKYGTAEEQDYIDEVYPNTESISVDFAILEKAENVKVIPADIGWSDLGTWNSLYNYLDKTEDNNVVQVDRSMMIDVEGCMISSVIEDKLIVAKGLKDYIVIDEEDVLLIFPRNDEQEIKQVRNALDFPGIK